MQHRRKPLLAVLITAAICLLLVILIGLPRQIGLVRDGYPTPSVTPDRAIQLSDDDKEQIISEVLKRESTREARGDNKNGPKTLYVLREDRLFQRVPKLEEIVVEYISEAEINTKKKEQEIVYYEFRDFEPTADSVLLPVIFEKRDSSSAHSAIISYTARRISDKWVVEGKVTGMAVAEGP